MIRPPSLTIHPAKPPKIQSATAPGYEAMTSTPLMTRAAALPTMRAIFPARLIPRAYAVWIAAMPRAARLALGRERRRAWRESSDRAVRQFVRQSYVVCCGSLHRSCGSLASAIAEQRGHKVAGNKQDLAPQTEGGGFEPPRRGLPV